MRLHDPAEAKRPFTPSGKLASKLLPPYEDHGWKLTWPRNGALKVMSPDDLGVDIKTAVKVVNDMHWGNTTGRGRDKAVITFPTAANVTQTRSERIGGKKWI